MAASQEQQGDPFEHVVGSLGDEKRINTRLEWAAQHCLLISPSTSCRLPPGCSVAFNRVKVNPATEAHSVGYGKVALLRTAVLKLANAAGICWDEKNCGRVDDGSDPHYVHWHVSGAWRGLDGTVLPVPGDLQMDLRDGGQQVLKILESATGNSPKEKAEKGRVQLRDTRAKILEHAQSKAELRAIRKALAIRSYTEAELQAKPFVVARLVFDGHDEDPVIEAENKRAIRGMMLGGSRALFGAPPVERALPPARAYDRLPAASMRSTPDAEFDDDSYDSTPPPPPTPRPHTAPAAHRPPSEPPAQAAAPTTQAAPAAHPTQESRPSQDAGAPADGEKPRSGHVIPGGRGKGTPIEDAEEGDLQYWSDRIAGDLADGRGKPQFKDRDEALVAAMRSELASREGY